MIHDVTAGLVRLERIDYHPFNAGRDLGDLRPLTASIARNGLIHPVVVEKRGDRFRIRAGHRRVAAARMAGLLAVPALIHRDSLDDRSWLVHMVEENTLRKDLSEAERRAIVARLRSLGVAWEGVGAAFGVNPATARSWLTKATDETPERPRAPRERRPPTTISKRRLTEVLDDLEARRDTLTVDDCLGAIRSILTPAGDA